MKNLENSIETCFNYIFADDTSLKNTKKNILDFVKAQMSGNDSYAFPYSLLLQVSSQCNLRCKHCFYYGDEQNYIPDKDFSCKEMLELIDFMTDEINIINCAITGGEPFLREDIFLFLEKFKKKNVFIEIRTNATLITEHMAKQLGELLNPRFDNIQVSLDGATKETHDTIRGKGSFEKSINAINLLRKNNVNVSISYTMTSVNIREVPNLYELCKELGCKKIILNKICVCDETQVALVPELSEIFIYVSELINKMKKDNSIDADINLKVHYFLKFEYGKKLLDDYLKTENIPISKNLMCHNHNTLLIASNGNVSLCPTAEQNNLSFGNLREQSFFEIWENRHKNVLFWQRPLEKSICKNCNYISLCKSGCPAEAFKKYQDINCPESACFYGEILAKKHKIESKNYVK